MTRRPFYFLGAAQNEIGAPGTVFAFDYYSHCFITLLGYSDWLNVIADRFTGACVCGRPGVRSTFFSLVSSTICAGIRLFCVFFVCLFRVQFEMVLLILFRTVSL